MTATTMRKLQIGEIPGFVELKYLAYARVLLRKVEAKATSAIQKKHSPPSIFHQNGPLRVRMSHLDKKLYANPVAVTYFQA
jgi:hypothetical protein